MIVASGSTPLITLVKAAQLDVLHEPFDEVVISDAAFRELTTNPHLSEEADQIRPELRLSGTALRVLMALFTTIDLAYECILAFFRGHYASGSRKLPRSVDSLVASGGTIWNASVCLLASGVRAT